MSFEILAGWLYQLLSWKSKLKANDNDEYLQHYLEVSNFAQEWERIQKNSASKRTLLKSFFNWFDAFRLMKYLHFMRDQGYEDVSINDCMSYILAELKLPYDFNPNVNLEVLRQYDLRCDYRINAVLT